MHPLKKLDEIKAVIDMNSEIKQRIEQIKNGEIPNGYTATKAGVLPKWDCVRLNQIAEPITKIVGNGTYETLSISAGIGFVNQAKKFGKELSGKQYEKYTVLKRGDFSYNKGNSKTYPQGCIYRLKDRETAAVPNVFESFKIKKDSPDYYEQLFTSGYLNKQLSKKINHGVRDNGLLNLTEKDFYSCYVPHPPIAEQQKIAEILMQCDKLIELYQNETDELQKLKKICLCNMFPKNGNDVPEWRFPQFTDSWEQRKLGDLLQTLPFKQFLKEPEPDGKYEIIQQGNEPVIGFANGTPCGDYKDVVIFGDHTLSLYKPQHPFFVATDGVRIVKGQQDTDGYYLPSLLERYKPQSEGYKRYYIILADTNCITTYNTSEQEKIGVFFKLLDNLITLHQHKLEEMKKYKKSLMQLLLTGIVRVQA